MDEDEEWLAGIVMSLLLAQMERVLRNPDWGWENHELGIAMTAALTTIATRRLWAVWPTMTDRPIPQSVFGQVATWARNYSYHLVTGINDITRSQLGMYMQRYVTEGWTLGELREAIATIFGPDRAQRIAVTEVTRAYVEAGRISADELAAMGLPMIEIWRTNADQLVCDDCEPRNGKALGDGWERSDGPPAHPNCRCITTFEVA
jgi:hypothetical protein